MHDFKTLLLVLFHLLTFGVFYRDPEKAFNRRQRTLWNAVTALILLEEHQEKSPTDPAPKLWVEHIVPLLDPGFEDPNLTQRAEAALGISGC